MSNNYFISAFGTFGNPNGFRQSYWFTNDRNIVNSIKTFDLNTNAIKLFPKSKVYAIRKDYANGRNVIAYSVYSYAKEQNSDRSGTFIGSSILFIDQISEENITLNCLNDFHNNLKNKNIQNDTITVNHSENLSVSKPKDFDKINFQLREIDNLNFVQNSNKQLVVYCETNPSKLQALFKKSIDLLNVFDTIYFTQSKEVAEFVHQKNIFHLVQENGFETEIQKLAEERLQKIQNSLDEFTREKQKLEEDRKRLIDEYKKQIEQNERQHQENSRKINDSKNEISNINQKYEAYSKKIDESITRLKGGENLDNVRRLHNENKRIFIDSINRQEKPNFLNSISKPNTRTDLKTAPKPVQSGHLYDNDDEKYHRSRRKQGIDIFKVATLVLLLLWIGTLVYFLFFSKPEKETVYINEQQETTTKAENLSTESTSNQELNPKPNGELNENDYRLVAKKINHNTAVNEVVEIIFKENPTDIKSHYDTQKEIYSKQLIDKNKDCFEDRNGIFHFVKDTLRHIPSYKKQ
ncbi:MAG: hypothetical protein QM564_03750 [Bergeyella sp.]